MNLPQFVQDKLTRIEEQNQTLDRTLTVNSVLLRKRLRDWTADDAFSVFNNQTGNWKRVESRGLHSLNIIKPMIKATTAAVITADVKVTLEPRFVKDSKTEMAAEVCNAIKDLKTPEQWTSQLQELIATEPQIAPGVFLSVDWNPYAKKSYTIDEWGEDEFEMGGKAVCKQCGYEMEGVMDADTVPCECGGEAEVVEAPQKQKVDVVKDVKSYKSGDTRTRVIPSAEIVIDNRGTSGGNLKAARWMIHRYLTPLAELRTEYANCPGVAPFCMPLDWQQALSTGQDQPSTKQTPDDLVEVRDFYMTPQMYDLEELDESFTLDDGKATRFSVKIGQTIGEGVFNGQPFSEPPVLCIRTVGNVILDIFPADFREMFIYISFLSNPSMFWGLFLTEMLPLQDDVNYMYTVQMFHTKRNARTTKVLNSGSFDPEDVEKDVVLTKDPLPYDVNINNTFGIIPAVPLNNAPMELISTIMAVKGDIGGVTPAMQGAAAPDETYSAQRQQKEQSMGQLTPFLRSIALGKVSWTLRQLKEAQDNWSEEDFNFLLKLNGDWDDEYIEAFLNCNLDTDIIIDYEKGSESPRNLLDREMALRQFMQDVMALAQMTGQPMKQDLADEILLRIKQFTQVDVDVANTEAEMRLADARYDKILALIDGMELPEGTPPEVVQLMAAQMVNTPDLTPSQFEDATTEIEFFKDKITSELSQDAPNFMLIACCEAQINMHLQVAVQMAARTAQMEMEAQAPLQEQQMQMQQEQVAAQQQQGEQQMAQEKESRDSEMEFEREKMAMSREDKLMDASLSMAQAEHAQKIAPKDKKNSGK